MDLVLLSAVLASALAATAAVAAVLAVARARAVSAYREVRDMLHAERHARSAAELRLARVADFDAAERATRGSILRWCRVHEKKIRHMETVLSGVLEVYPTEDFERRQLEVGGLLLKIEQIRAMYGDEDDPDSDNGHAG